jgi:hypothetical protein
VKPAVPLQVAIPVEDAYKAFKATSSSNWESIEQTRRLFVQQCHPERLKAMTLERRSSSLAEARWVNAAYETLSRIRCGGPLIEMADMLMPSSEDAKTAALSPATSLR